MLWISSALAGAIFFVPSDEYAIKEMDTRTLIETPFVPVPTISHEPAGLAASETELWFHSQRLFTFGEIWNINIQSGTIRGGGNVAIYESSALAYDPVRGEFIAFGGYGTPGVYPIVGPMLSPGPVSGVNGAEWDPLKAGFLVVDGRTDFYRITSYGAPVFERSEPPEITAAALGGHTLPSGLAYDPDTKVMWYLTQNDGIWGLDPLTLDVIAQVPRPSRPNLQGAAALQVDPTPGPDPELLVTGVCPGTVYITAVDAKPGGEVSLVSGTRLGSRAAPAGPCQGTTVNLANPIGRTALTASSQGIAATRVRATRGMCGRTLIQAVDMDTCLTTSVGTIPATVP